MDTKRIGRWAELRRRQRDVERARVIDAESALARADELCARAEQTVSLAVSRLASTESVASAELELRSREIIEASAERRTVGLARTRRGEELELARATRVAAEREVRVLDVLRDRSAIRDRLETERRERRVEDDRAARRRRSA